MRWDNTFSYKGQGHCKENSGIEKPLLGYSQHKTFGTHIFLLHIIKILTLSKYLILGNKLSISIYFVINIIQSFDYNIIVLRLKNPSKESHTN